MARFRKLYHQIWSDPDFQEYTPEQKLLFIYAFSNNKTTESGIYNITARTISHETGISLETVDELLVKGFKNISYDIVNHCIYVRKFRIYNPGGNPSLISKSIVADYNSTRNTGLWGLFIKDYPQHKDALINAGLQPDQITLTLNNTNGNCKGSGSGSGIELLPNSSETVVPPLNKKISNLIKIYEENIGVATPVVLRELNDICDVYPDGWFEEATGEAVRYNARNLIYIKAILETWFTKGKNNGSKKKVNDGWD
jgi:DnaD/phage-associated family protein